MRGAFTLIEVMVALVLFQIAMLALAGTSAVMARELATAHRQLRAQSLARGRLELLRVRACLASGTGSAEPTGGFIERWTIEGSGVRRSIVVTVEFPLPRGRSGRVVRRGTTICPW